MKHRIFVRHHFLMCSVFFFSLLCHIVTMADYKPMLKDGRVWNCIEVYENSVCIDSLGNIIDLDEETIDIEEIWNTLTFTMVLDTVKVNYHIDGTETIDNRECYKLYSGNRLLSYYYEEDGRVYALLNDEWVEGYDFTLEVGDGCPYVTGQTIHSVDTIKVAGAQYRRLSTGYSDDEGRIYWIEGMGSTCYGPNFFAAKYEHPFTLRWMGVMSVFDGGTCLFEKKNFQQPNISTNVEAEVGDGRSAGQEIVHDLLGRKISDGTKKGVYIKNGRKRVVR